MNIMYKKSEYSVDFLVEVHVTSWESLLCQGVVELYTLEEMIAK